MPKPTKRAVYYVGDYTFDIRQKGTIEGLCGYIYANEQELLQAAREHGGMKVVFADADGKERVLYDPKIDRI